MVGFFLLTLYKNSRNTIYICNSTFQEPGPDGGAGEAVDEREAVGPQAAGRWGRLCRHHPQVRLGQDTAPRTGREIAKEIQYCIHIYIYII